MKKPTVKLSHRAFDGKGASFSGRPFSYALNRLVLIGLFVIR
ncbi:hypothetical protein SAMN05443094_10457 [Domibacillus enclensis]|uniref:Uncharacterized protein n=1 Tax=Domibacillus enclensis TaxID=1017273 RepID=A0A1N6W388_9BACI|nr:hypothetical protein SAMN05443094_10457 [Domibacillus enclensis]